LTSAIVSRLGIDFGPGSEMFAGTKFNPYGYFERNDINEVNSLLISSAGFSLADPGSPDDICNSCDKSLAERLKFHWMRSGAPWGIKDPRMCATLLAWIRLNLIDADKLAIIHVQRELDAATASGVKDPNIPKYCDGTEQGIRSMLAKYSDLAEWHVRQLNVPTLSVRYEELINDPTRIITELAQFTGTDSKDRINAAAKLVGKEKAVRQYYWHRWLVRAPKKLVRILAGK
jgi:hypothetical protein